MPVLDPTTTGEVDFGEFKTWYRITGDLDRARDEGRTPLVILHGGPGASHDYTLRMTMLSERGRPVVHYDQLGCGRSTHLPDKGADFWTVQLFLDELDEPARPPGHRRRLRRARPVVGRHARRRARDPPPGRACARW